MYEQEDLYFWSQEENNHIITITRVRVHEIR